jgi:hypothetical protein
LPVVKIKSSTLREEHRRTVFEIRGLGRKFGLKRDKGTRGVKILHNREL